MPHETNEVSQEPLVEVTPEKSLIDELPTHNPVTVTLVEKDGMVHVTVLDQPQPHQSPQIPDLINLESPLKPERSLSFTQAELVDASTPKMAIESPFANTFKMEEEVALSKLKDKPTSTVGRSSSFIEPGSFGSTQSFNPIEFAQKELNRRRSTETLPINKDPISPQHLSPPLSPVDLSKKAEWVANFYRSHSTESLSQADQTIKPTTNISSAPTQPLDSNAEASTSIIIDDLAQRLAASSQHVQKVKKVLKKGR